MKFFKTFIVFFLLPLLFGTLLFAEKVEITSDSMKAEQEKKEVHFIGNVKIKQLESRLYGDKVIVYFDENNETEKYEAIGSVRFEIKKEKMSYKGRAERVVHYPLQSKYMLSGKAVIEDLVNKRRIKGEVITLDMVSGNANVKGNEKKPVKFIFDTEKSK